MSVARPKWIRLSDGSVHLRSVRHPRASGAVVRPLRVLLGIDERHRPPRLVILLRPKRGPSLTQGVQLPEEYLDLLGIRSPPRDGGVDNPIMTTPDQPRKERVKVLLRDDRVRRWYRGYHMANPVIATGQLRGLSRLLDNLGLSASAAIYLGRYEPARLGSLLDQWVAKRRRGGRQASYLKNTLVPLRAIFERERVPFYDWPRLKVLGAPTLASERVPTPQELGRICSGLEPQWRAAALLIAQSGLRPGVLCKNPARSGVQALQLKHLPDLKLKPRRHFERIPFRIDVPAELSKIGQSYLTFGGQEAADALLAYLDGRTKPVIVDHHRIVKQHRERISPESYVIAGREAGKKLVRAGHPVYEFVLSASIRRGIRKVQPEGVRWRPYVLRTYFSTRLFLAECRGLILRDVREYLLGHSTGSSGRYVLGKKLGEDIIEEMRSMYVKALPFLETPRTIRNTGDGRNSKFQDLGPSPAGLLTPEEKERFPGLSDPEFVDRLSHGLRGVEDELPQQQVVPIAEGRRLVKQGWIFVGKLGAGEVVVRSP